MLTHDMKITSYVVWKWQNSSSIPMAVIVFLLLQFVWDLLIIIQDTYQRQQNVESEKNRWLATVLVSDLNLPLMLKLIVKQNSRNWGWRLFTVQFCLATSLDFVNLWPEHRIFIVCMCGRKNLLVHLRGSDSVASQKLSCSFCMTALYLWCILGEKRRQLRRRGGGLQAVTEPVKREWQQQLVRPSHQGWSASPLGLCFGSSSWSRFVPDEAVGENWKRVKRTKTRGRPRDLERKDNENKKQRYTV